MVSKVEHRTRSNCPIANSLDILGDHWTLIIIRNLMFDGLHEYKDMLQTAEQISSGILTERLKKLEERGLISSIPHPESKKRKLYYLTEMGKDLIDVMVDLVIWGLTYVVEGSSIPAKAYEQIMRAPEEFKSSVLSQLEAWETQYLARAD